MRISGLLALFMLFVCPHILAAAQASSPHPLTNQDVVAMVNAHFDDATMIKAIQAQDTNFDISVGGLVSLKTAGVSQTVIQAMLSVVAAGRPSVSNSVKENSAVAGKTDDLPDDVGLYVQRNGKLTAMEPEIVNWRTGGVVKSMATLGLDKGHVNGTVNGPHSPFSASWPPLGMAPPAITFYIRCSEGGSAAEYQLLRLWEKEGRREFRSVTGGILHAASGAEDNVVPFSFEKAELRTYKISLPATNSNLASQGGIYSFRVVE